jgi:uroporphyrinogen decarboxylase
LPGAHIDFEWGNVEIKGQYENISRVLHYALEDAETVDDIEKYPMPDLLEPYRWLHVRGEVEKLHARNLACMGCMSQTIFEVAWGVRGFENLLIDFMENRLMAEALLDRITDMRVEQSRIFAQADVDVLRLGDDVGTERGMMISPTTFKEWLKPGFVRIIKAAREAKPDILIFYHSDGDCREIIPDLIDIGIDILNPVQPECMNPAEIKIQYGDRLAFWGTIGNQTTMPFGTPEDVIREVRERIETVGKGGGLLLTPSHLLQAEVPWENVVAFFKAVDEYGIYN